MLPCMQALPESSGDSRPLSVILRDNPPGFPLWYSRNKIYAILLEGSILVSETRTARRIVHREMTDIP